MLIEASVGINSKRGTPCFHRWDILSREKESVVLTFFSLKFLLDLKDTILTYKRYQNQNKNYAH